MSSAAAEAKFRAFISGIVDPELRNRVEDSAMCNSFAVEVHGEYSDDKTRWEVALSTAEMCVDCARDYYPELFSDKPLGHVFERGRFEHRPLHFYIA